MIKLVQGGTQKLGQCPIRLPSELNEGQCLLACKSDASCSPDQRCCFNGCGLSCQLVPRVPEISTEVPLPPVTVPMSMATTNMGFFTTTAG